MVETPRMWTAKRIDSRAQWIGAWVNLGSRTRSGITAHPNWSTDARVLRRA